MRVPTRWEVIERGRLGLTLDYAQLLDAAAGRLRQS